MDLPSMPYYYPAFPMQSEHLHGQRLTDGIPTVFSSPASFYFQPPTYIPAVQQVCIAKPTTDIKPSSYNKNDLRSSIFNQILEAFPELSSSTGSNHHKDPPSCRYDVPTPVRYSARQPYEANIASDIMQEEFELNSPPQSDFISSQQQPKTSSVPSPHDQVSQLLKQVMASATARATKPRKPKQPIVCYVCHKTFSSKPNLKVHFQSHQENSRPHQCQHCGKRFTQRSTLRTHVRIHTGEKPYSCTHCHKSFSDFSTFTKHARIHTGERPYVCSVCGKGFAQSGNMIRHKETHTTS